MAGVITFGPIIFINEVSVTFYIIRGAIVRIYTGVKNRDFDFAV